MIDAIYSAAYAFYCDVITVDFFCNDEIYTGVEKFAPVNVIYMDDVIVKKLRATFPEIPGSILCEMSVIYYEILKQPGFYIWQAYLLW